MHNHNRALDIMVENLMNPKSAFALAALLSLGSATAETFEVELFNTFFQPNDLTIQAGDTVRWINRQGVHDVLADDGSFSSGAPANAPFEFEMVFDAPGETLYHCSVHSIAGRDINLFMNGRVMVEGAAFVINQGIAGAWFSTSTPGQGFLIDIEPASGFMFVAWFTYEEASVKVGAAGQRWLTAQGTIQDGGAELDLFSTSGGLFDDPQATDTVMAGGLDFSFSDCSNAIVSYDLPDDGLSGQIEIVRLVPGTEALCETLAMPAQ